MQTPVELTFRHMEPDTALRDLITKKIAHLEEFYGGITSCHVTVQPGHKRHKTGNLYEVSLEVRVPGDEIFIKTNQGDVAQHEHPQVAVRDAFKAMERKLEAWKQTIRGDVKTHEGMLQGRVAQIDHEKGFGQINTVDNRLIYFHKNAVIDGDFADLQPRDAVELVVQSDESVLGPQASTVRPISGLKYAP